MKPSECKHFQPNLFGKERKCELCGGTAREHPGQPGINPKTGEPFKTYSWGVPK